MKTNPFNTLNPISKSVDLNKINNLIDIHRQKTFKIEQLKNSTYSQLGFTFKPVIKESNKYKVHGTFEQRNYTNHYPNRESFSSKKKYVNSNKDVSSIVSIYNMNNNPDFGNTSKISVKTYNNLINHENSFSSKNSIKNNLDINNKNCTPISNPNKKNPNFSSKTKNGNFSSKSKATKNNIESSIISNNCNNITNATSNISKNQSKSIKSSICNFSTTKNSSNIDEENFLNKIVPNKIDSRVYNENLKKQNHRILEDLNENLNSNASNTNNNTNNNFTNNNSNNNTNNSNNNNSNNNTNNSNTNNIILNKKPIKLQETRDLVKLMNSKIKATSNRDLELMDHTIDEINSNIYLDDSIKNNNEDNLSNKKNTNNNYNTNNEEYSLSDNNYNLNQQTDERKDKNTKKENFANSNHQSLRENRNKNYGNIIYSFNNSEKSNIENKSIRSRNALSINDFNNNQENSNLNYSNLDKTDGEGYNEKD